MPRSKFKHSNVLSLFLTTLLPLAASLTMSCAGGAGSGGSQPDGGSAITVDPANGHGRLGRKLEQVEHDRHGRLDRRLDRADLIDRARLRLWCVLVSSGSSGDRRIADGRNGRKRWHGDPDAAGDDAATPGPAARRRRRPGRVARRRRRPGRAARRRQRRGTGGTTTPPARPRHRRPPAGPVARPRRRRRPAGPAALEAQRHRRHAP